MRSATEGPKTAASGRSTGTHTNGLALLRAISDSRHQLSKSSRNLLDVTSVRAATVAASASIRLAP